MQAPQEPRVGNLKDGTNGDDVFERHTAAANEGRVQARDLLSCVPLGRMQKHVGGRLTIFRGNMATLDADGIREISEPAKPNSLYHSLNPPTQPGRYGSGAGTRARS